VTPYSNRFLILLLIPVFLVLPGANTFRHYHPALLRLPAQILWAWERPEDLRWLPPEVGVAYVAMAVELQGSKIRLRPRTQALQVAEGTALIPVVHVDALWHPSPKLTLKQRDAIVTQVLRSASAGNTKVVQLDFEVRSSQREFLAEVVRETRRRLPRDYALSLTALASWCAGDYWLGELEADEIVPMVFRMADDAVEIRSLLAQHHGFVRARCAAAIASANDEPVAALHVLRHYYFSPVSWTPELWMSARLAAHP